MVPTLAGLKFAVPRSVAVHSHERGSEEAANCRLLLTALTHATSAVSS